MTGGHRATARRAALRALVRAYPGRTFVLALCAALAGALPAIFAALVGVLVAALPGVVDAGFGSSAGHRATGALIAIGVVLVALEAVSALDQIVCTDLYRRFDGHLLGRVLGTALRRDDLLLTDDPRLAAALDRARRAARYGPGELVSGLNTQWTVRAQGLAAAVLVGCYEPLLAAALTVLWLAAARALRTSYYRADPLWTDPLRRARHLQDIGLLPHWAKEIRIFGLVPWLVEQYSREWQSVIATLWRARRADRRTLAILGGLLLAAHLGAALLLARAAGSGSLSPAALTVVLQGLFAMASLSSQQGDVWIENGAVPMPDVLALEAAVPDQPPATAPATGRPRHEIAFRGVDFGYPGRSAPVLRGFDLRIEAGRSLAVVGLNGSGKTTMVKLLAGLAHPDAGTITVDGLDLATLDPTAWRRRLAVIFQDFVRYELPLRDNVAFGAPHRHWSDEQLAQVVAQAGATGLVAALPAGPDTTLSPRFAGGVDLSGGQWQRVAFARALLAVRGGADVLVMDEPTAHLDVRAEADLYDRFLQLTRGLTTIVISHRFATVRRADRIVVLDGGCIVEDGTHAELAGADGHYGRLFRLQADNYTGSGDD